MNRRHPVQGQLNYDKVADLQPHPLNEKIYGVTELDQEFENSIKKDGILTPLTVAHMSLDGGENFGNFIISGHRRWAAAKKIGLTVVPTWYHSLTHNSASNPNKLLELECQGLISLDTHSESLLCD